MTRKIVLSGYYGFDNIGDEAVLYSIIEALKLKMETDMEPVVLSANPQKTQQLYGVKAVDRWDKKAIYRAIKESDLLISGGGSLLQDVSSANSPLYYLAIIKLAQWLKKPVVIYAQGIGPLNRKRNRWLCGKIINKATTITVRDKESADELHKMGVKSIINVTSDPVLAMSVEKAEQKKGQEILQALDFDFEKSTIMVSLRPWQDNRYIKEVASCLDELVREGRQVLLLPLQKEQDLAVLMEVQQQMEQKALVLTEQLNPTEMFAVLSFADKVLGMRLHSLIMATALNKDAVGIVYDPKVSSFMESVGNQKYLNWDNLETKELKRMLDASFEGYDDLKHLQERAIVPACFTNSILLK